MKVSMIVLSLTLARENRKFNDNTNKVTVTFEIEPYDTFYLTTTALTE